MSEGRDVRSGTHMFPKQLLSSRMVYAGTCNDQLSRSLRGPRSVYGFPERRGRNTERNAQRDGPISDEVEPSVDPGENKLVTQRGQTITPIVRACRSWVFGANLSKRKCKRLGERGNEDPPEANVSGISTGRFGRTNPQSITTGPPPARDVAIGAARPYA